MKKFLVFPWILTMVFTGSGCSDDNPTPAYEAFNIPASLELPATIPVLGNEKDSQIIIPVTTNQPTLDITVDEKSQSWCLVSIQQNNIVITAGGKNLSSSTRTASITVTAGLRNNTQTQTIEIVQEAGEGGGGTDQGVVFWQDDEANPTEIKIVSGTCSDKGIMWADRDHTAPIGTTHETDGAVNQAAAEAIPDYQTLYTAFNYCKEMGEGWYLPSKQEMIQIFEAYNGTSVGEATIANPIDISQEEKDARAAFDAKLMAIEGGRAMNEADQTAAGDSYWTSTEATGVNVFWVRMGKYAIDGGAKYSTARKVRCVKKISLTE